MTTDGPLEVTLAGCGDAPTVDRLAGANRIATAVEVSRASFTGGAPAAVMARADSYADALAGAELDAPLRLTAGDRLSPEVALELQRLGVSEVVILGGEAALSLQVAQSVAATRSSPAVPGRDSPDHKFRGVRHRVSVVTEKLFVLDDETWVYPGHGDDTTFGAERPHLEEWRERGW